MATSPSSVYGLMSPQGKGKLSLQTLGQVQDDTDGTLPASPFSNLTPVGPQGAVQAPAIQAAQLPANFQFTGEYDAANRALGQQESDAGLNRTNSLAQIAEKYLSANRAADTANKRGRSKMYEIFADKGALGSSAVLDRFGEYDSDYNTYLDSLAKSRAYDQSSIESGYASTINNLGRAREGLASSQQKAEEDRRVEEARVQAEAERARVEEETRRTQIQQLIDAQERTRQEAETRAQQQTAASYAYQAPPTYSYGGGGGYDGGGFEAPAPEAPQAPQGNIVMPAFNNGVTQQAVEGWIHQNVDPNISGVALAKVREVLAKAGPQGVSQADLGWLINQYPNNPVPTQTAPKGTAAPTRRV